MPAQYLYKVSASSNVDFSARVRADTTSMTANAEQGSVAVSPVEVDDPDAGINIVGLHQFDWKETSEGSNSRTIRRGFITDRTVHRGPFRVGQARSWTVNVADLNSIINRRIMLGSDANRPAENDAQRVQWLMGTNEFNLVTDSSLINTTDTTPMDAVDYRNQTIQNILDDCSQASGKNFFIWLNEIPATPTYGLFYDFPYSTAYASTIRLSNVLSDVDSVTTFPVSETETKLSRDPSRVYSGVVLPYVGGQVYVQDESIATAFMRRDTMAPSVNVKTAAKAQARAIRYIGDANTEDDVVSTAFEVPLAQVNQLREGHRVQARFQHLPGYETFSPFRVLNRTVTAISEEKYKIGLELSGVAGGAGGGKVLLAFFAGASGDLGGGTVTTPTLIDGTAWNALYWSGNFCWTNLGGAGPPTLQAMGIWARDVVPGESATVLHTTNCGPTGGQVGIWVYEISGVVGGAAALSLVGASNVTTVANGALSSLSTSAGGTSHALFGSIAWGKVGYDNGWMSVPPAAGNMQGAGLPAIVTTSAGSELANASLANGYDGGGCPWMWQAYTTGTGTLTLTAQTLAGSYGAGAYTGGWMTGRGAVSIPINSSFSIVQRAFGGGGSNTSNFVTLPAPP